MAANNLNQFLGQVATLVQARDGNGLRDLLVIEPPYQPQYMAMINELQNQYNSGQEDALESYCMNAIPEAREGPEDGSTKWSSFVKFLVSYFSFIKKVNLENLLEAYNMLSEVLQRCNSALRHPTLGVVMLPTVVNYSRLLARLAIGLNKQPELIAHVARATDEDGGSAETLPERAANLIRESFVACLNDKTPANSTQGPASKKVGIYKLTNICLKILFACRKTRNAEQFFNNIYKQSPPLDHYPRSERVTYLYYLGRFHFSCNHFIRAQEALQEAYDECHTRCVKQKRLILIYLTTSNIILGRLPSPHLFSLEHAAGFQEIFGPICKAITQGNLASFRQLTDLDGPYADWMLKFRILIPLQNRCEPLVWRSLIRKIFLVNGFEADAAARKASYVDLANVLTVVRVLEAQNQSEYVDPDLEGAEEAQENDAFITMLEIESVFTSLIVQGLLGGYLSKKFGRFAISGARNKGILAAGFPNVWQTIASKHTDTEIPGWKRAEDHESMGGVGRPGPGTVINLSGARPVGVGA